MTETNHPFLLDSQILATDFAPDERVALSLRATVEDQAEEIRQLDATISNLETQLDELRAHRAEIQRSYDLRKGLLAPIRKLPPETLGEVFLHCIPDWEISLNEAPLLLMQVCRRWRRVTLGTPCLWTRLSLGSGFRLDPCHIIRMWLSNSGTLPISVEIEPEMWLLRWDRRGALRIIVQSFHRFRHFTTFPFTEDLYDELRLIGTPIHAPLLESFTALGFEEDGALETCISQLDGCILAPKLIHISVTHNVLMNLMAFHPMSLTRVFLETDQFPEIHPSLQFLATCRNIRRLELDIAGSILPPNIDGQQRILLPLLEELSVQCGYEYDPCPFLQTIEVPALRELSIELREPNDVVIPLLLVTLNSLLKDGSSLQRLHLSGVDLTDGPPFVSMLSRLHNLHSLTIYLCDIEDSILEALTPDTSSPPSAWICPLLSTLLLRDFSQSDILLALIRNRAPVGLEDTSTGAGYLRYVNVGTDREPGCIAALEEIKSLCDGRLEIRYE